MRGARKQDEAGANRKTARLEELKGAFAAYRARFPNASTRRYPRDLRRKVLLALDAGLPTGDVLSACRITNAHLRRWQGEQDREKAEGIVEAEPARVFEVAPNPAPELAGSGPESIEIRIGRWSLELRLEQSSAHGS